LSGFVTVSDPDGGSVTELRAVHATDVDLAAGTIQLGHRPQPTPLDAHTTTALRRVLAHRQATRADNPHLLVNQKTKTIAGPVSTVYLTVDRLAQRGGQHSQHSWPPPGSHRYA
jgi:hypothetical protein